MGAYDRSRDDPDRIALFLDVDGTLIDFAARPEDARAPADLPEILGAAAARVGGALALVSGRSIGELDRLMSPLRLPACGLHGAEIRIAADGPASSHTGLPPSIAASLRHELAGLKAVVLEDKGASVAVHYRAAPQLGPELHALLTRYLNHADVPPLELMVGELVYELKPPGFDKGTAISTFMQSAPFAGRQPVFIADHPIDQAGFSAAAALGGYGLSVGRLLPGATDWFSDTAAVRAWLRDIS